MSIRRPAVSWSLWTFVLLLAVCVTSGCAWIPRSYVAKADHSATTEYELVEGSPLYKLIPRGWISPVDAPRFADVSAAARFMDDDEPVMVVDHGGDVRIYSTWYLDGHEVVNDVVGGTPMAVTWCPLVQAGVVFERELDVDGAPTSLRLQASGLLWRDALVMYDRQTKSLWTQHDGRSIRGPSQEAGRALPMVQSATTTWAAARERHPDARVLRKKADLLGGGQATIYDDYLARTDQLGIFGTHLADDSLPGKALVFGFVRPESAYALSLDGLSSLGGAAMSVGGDPVYAHVLPGGKDARVWHRADGAVNELLDLSLSTDGRSLSDAGLGARWDAFDGSKLAGPEALGALRGETGKVVYWFAWQQNHPDGRVWAGESYTQPSVSAEELADEAPRGDHTVGARED